MKIKAKFIQETETSIKVEINSRQVWISKNGVKKYSKDKDEIEITDEVYQILKDMKVLEDKENKKEEKENE